VGGGSTELTYFANNELVFKQSFNIGTIRLLKGLSNESLWDELKDTIKEKIKGQKNIIAIGTGGNINKVFSMSKKKEGKPLDLELLKDYYKEFSSCTLEDRIRIYNLREDRADVIVPALLIYIQIMKWANINEILVPKIGLADGLIQHLYAEMAG
jgi:exopolyphosphatase/guanosine-5'-triphosphate,3'-diphosphate pyrophosphatase